MDSIVKSSHVNICVRSKKFEGKLNKKSNVMKTEFDI